MLPSGDFEMLEPLLRMYREALPSATARTQTYFAHAGAFFPETLYFWGSYPDDVYGWKREGLELGITENTFVRYYYDGALELLAMMLDLYAHNHDERLVRETVLPLAQAVLTFYDLHYPRDSQGRLWLVPAQALETWQTAVNPLPPLAGLHAVLSALLALPPGLASEAERESWGELQAILPEVPRAERQDGEVLVAAEELLEDALNSENPELYAIFPYRLFGVGKPDLQMARRTFQKRRVKGNDGWRQDDIQAAWLGLAAEASERLRARAKMRNPEQRFPAFWGPNYDWTPDQDHGSNLLLALQAMLLQADGRTITLFPAWPKAWDVEFKLHAPHKTIVQGSFRNGKLEALGVTPVERRADLIIMEPQ